MKFAVVQEYSKKACFLCFIDIGPSHTHTSLKLRQNTDISARKTSRLILKFGSLCPCPNDFFHGASAQAFENAGSIAKFYERLYYGSIKALLRLY